MRLLLLTLLALRLHAADAVSTAPAAITKEGDLVILTLKPEAEQALRLKTVPIERRIVPAVRLFSGQVVTPLAAEGRPVAPLLGGTLDEILRLADLQAAADGRVLQAQAQIEAAKIALQRAKKMLSAEAGSVRGVDESTATLHLAEALLTTAQAQRDLLGSPVGKEGGRRAWIRVAIYGGEASLLDEHAAAAIRPIRSAGKILSARPVKGPATANAQTNTVDWYYELPVGMSLRAGEIAAVEIPTTDGKQDILVVPFKAVLHDIHGGQWVYVRTGEHRYVRRRIQVARLAGTDALLATGPAAGTQVVTDGSAELFGTEFMTGK